MSLTQHQQNAYESVKENLNRYPAQLLQGAAGTGKTFLLDTLVKSLPGNYKEIVISAPTHKALAVLKEKIQGSYTFMTIQAVMKLKRFINNKDGSIYFEPDFDSKYPPLKGVKYLIIDECSMIDERLLNNILRHSAQQNTKVLFVGDENQINPVNEEDSIVFKKDFPTTTLTEIVRQGAGNPIIQLSRNLSNIYSYDANRNDIGGYVYTNDKQKIIETLAAVNGNNDLKYLAWTNQEVDSVNERVRHAIYGENPAKINIGETLVFNAPYGNYYTNQELRVDRSIVREKSFFYKIGKDDTEKITLKYYSINYTKVYSLSAENITDVILVIHEDSERDLEKILKLLRTYAKSRTISWVDYYNFAEQFADLKYNHALSVHKSQGSTFKQCIVNIGNINFNRNEKEKVRLLYTAVTRASELLILYNA